MRFVLELRWLIDNAACANYLSLFGELLPCELGQLSFDCNCIEMEFNNFLVYGDTSE